LLRLAKSAPERSPAHSSFAESADDALLARLAQDDTRALEEALARYWPLVVDYVARLTGSRDAAEDVAQRAFCRLWDRRAHWGGGPTGSLRALLCRIARNAAVSDHRRRLADARTATTFFELTDVSPPAMDVGDADRLRAIVAAEVDRLPARRREIVVLRCYHDLSYKEIAEVMDIAEQTVANQLSRALASLRGTLGKVLD
jgi:RNA polymerase sigma-70 factor (ECF subfamily)